MLQGIWWHDQHDSWAMESSCWPFISWRAGKRPPALVSINTVSPWWVHTYATFNQNEIIERPISTFLLVWLYQARISGCRWMAWGKMVQVAALYLSFPPATYGQCLLLVWQYARVGNGMLSNINALSGGTECRIQVMRNQQWWLSTIAAILPEGSGLAAELSEKLAIGGWVLLPW